MLLCLYAFFSMFYFAILERHLSLLCSPNTFPPINTLLLKNLVKQKIEVAIFTILKRPYPWPSEDFSSKFVIPFWAHFLQFSTSFWNMTLRANSFNISVIRHNRFSCLFLISPFFSVPNLMWSLTFDYRKFLRKFSVDWL